MLRLLAIAASLSFVVYSGTQAADATPPTLDENQVNQDIPFDWNGRYLGLQAGNARYHSEYSIDGFGVFSTADTHGLVAGVLAGINWHSDGILLGIEADANYADLSADSAGLLFPSEYTVDAFASIRGRIGITYDNLLIYASGGAAYIWANYDTNAFGASFNSDNSGFTPVWGGGVEYAFDNRTTLRLDFRHYEDYGVDQPNQQSGQISLFGHTINARMDVVTVALTKLF